MNGILLDHLLPDGRAGATQPDGVHLRVRGGLPGDLVEVELERSRGRVADATVTRVVTPSPHRRAVLCPHSASCGGCDLDAADPEARRGWLGEVVRHALRWEAPVEVVPSPRPVGHRARITLHLEGGRVGYRAPRSHVLVPVDLCAVARPELQVAHARLVELLARDPSAFEGLSDVELRTDGERTVFVFEGKPAKRHEALGALGEVVVGGRVLSGAGLLRLVVAGLPLRVSPRSFFQVNLEANELLSGHVRAELMARKPERVLDLYAGVGNLSLPLAAAGTPVVAVEVPGSGSEDLRHNAAGLPVEVHALPVERFDPSRTPFDAVVLDPPRAGAPGVLPRVIRNRPRLLVLVSCFVPSAARDLAEIKGYRVTSVRAFDLFPDTHHVETVIVLERA